MSERRNTKKVKQGKPAPPAPDSDTSIDALRARAETDLIQWWRKYAPAGYESLLESPAIDTVEDNAA